MGDPDRHRGHGPHVTWSRFKRLLFLGRIGSSLLLLTISSYGHRSLAQSSPTDKFCPVQVDKKPLPQYSIDYDGLRIEFCCETCLEAFKDHPEKYRAQLSKLRLLGANEQSRTEASWFSQVIREDNWPLWGSLAALIILLGRRFSAAPKHHVQVPNQSLGLVTVVLTALVIGLAWSHYHLLRQVDLDAAKESIHFRTYEDFGDPPIPYKPPIGKRIRATFYRGNDERSAYLTNGGHYRTATFELSLATPGSQDLTYDSDVLSHPLFIRFQIVRAPFTSEIFFADALMSKIFLTNKSEPFLELNTSSGDVPLQTVERLQRWEAQYPIGIVSGQARQQLSGIVYVGQQQELERLFATIKGTRFHYAIQYHLVFANGRISSESDLWMGALYRSRKSPPWKLPLHEWFSHEPIPELSGKNTDDSMLLGTDEYKK